MPTVARTPASGVSHVSEPDKHVDAKGDELFLQSARVGHRPDDGVHTNPTKSSSDPDEDVDDALLSRSTVEFHVHTDVDTFRTTVTVRLEFDTGDGVDEVAVGRQVHCTVSVSFVAVHPLATTVAGDVTEKIDEQVTLGSWHEVLMVGAQTTEVVFAEQTSKRYANISMNTKVAVSAEKRLRKAELKVNFIFLPHLQSVRVISIVLCPKK